MHANPGEREKKKEGWQKRSSFRSFIEKWLRDGQRHREKQRQTDRRAEREREGGGAQRALESHVEKQTDIAQREIETDRTTDRQAGREMRKGQRDL